MKRFFLPILCLIIIFAMSCEDTNFYCSDCNTKEPYEATLKCQIDIDDKNGTLVQIWEGKLEDNILIDSTRIPRSSTTKVFNKKVPLNRHYTITATYIIDNKTYVAVGSALPRIKHTDKCDEPCYYIYGNEVNLQLKYTK